MQSPAPSVIAACYFHLLQWLTKAVPRYLPQMVDDFGEDLWLKAPILHFHGLTHCEIVDMA